MIARNDSPSSTPTAVISWRRSSARAGLVGHQPHKIAAARRRVDCVRRFRRLRSKRIGMVRDWLPGLIVTLKLRYPGLRISITSLYRWDQCYGTSADLAKLIDTRGGDRRSAGDPAAWAAFFDLLDDDSEASIRSCWSHVTDLSREHGWRWCSLASCHRRIAKRRAGG